MKVYYCCLYLSQTLRYHLLPFYLFHSSSYQFQHSLLTIIIYKYAKLTGRCTHCNYCNLSQTERRSGQISIAREAIVESRFDRIGQNYISTQMRQSKTPKVNRKFCRHRLIISINVLKL